jgi:hypothetical protein
MSSTPVGAALVAALLALLGTGCGATVNGTSGGGPAVDTTARLGTAPPGASATPGAGTADSPGATPRCTPSQVTASVSTNRPAYPAGTPVTATTVLANHSAQPCSLSVSARDPGFSVSGGTGEVWQSCGPGQSCPLFERLAVLSPGGSQTVSTTWDQHTCSASACDGPPPPPGAYRMTATWSDLATATTVLTVG